MKIHNISRSYYFIMLDNHSEDIIKEQFKKMKELLKLENKIIYKFNKITTLIDISDIQYIAALKQITKYSEVVLKVENTCSKTYSYFINSLKFENNMNYGETIKNLENIESEVSKTLENVLSLNWSLRLFMLKYKINKTFKILKHISNKFGKFIIILAGIVGYMSDVQPFVDIILKIISWFN